MGVHSCLSNLASGDTEPARSGLQLSSLAAAGGERRRDRGKQKSKDPLKTVEDSNLIRDLPVRGQRDEPALQPDPAAQ